jgi:hypothetical protein
MSGYFDEDLKRERRSRIGRTFFSPIKFLCEVIGMMVLAPLAAVYFIVRYYQGYTYRTTSRPWQEMTIGEAAVVYSILGVGSIILEAILLWKWLA